MFNYQSHFSSGVPGVLPEEASVAVCSGEHPVGGVDRPHRLGPLRQRTWQTALAGKSRRNARRQSDVHCRGKNLQYAPQSYLCYRFTFHFTWMCPIKKPKKPFSTAIDCWSEITRSSCIKLFGLMLLEPNWSMCSEHYLFGINEVPLRPMHYILQLFHDLLGRLKVCFCLVHCGLYP